MTQTFPGKASQTTIYNTLPANNQTAWKHVLEWSDEMIHVRLATRSTKNTRPAWEPEGTSLESNTCPLNPVAQRAVNIHPSETAQPRF